MIDARNKLPAGSTLDEYIIQKTLGGGGFSFVYLATQVLTDRNVVIKEYFPHQLAKRNEDFSVSPVSEKVTKRVQSGRTLFLQEAEILAHLSHPNIVNVTGFFHANETVYMAMDYEAGTNLQSYIAKHKGGLSNRFLMTVFPPLLDALTCLHKNGYLHQDIKPGNIHLRKGANPLLLDFGAAHRRLYGRLFQSGLITTPGFTPIEQYRRNGYVGPWTDVYAIGASMRACIEGKSPMDTRAREKKDKMRPAVQAFRRRYQPELLEIIDWAMELDPLLRPQTTEELRLALINLDRENHLLKPVGVAGSSGQ